MKASKLPAVVLHVGGTLVEGWPGKRTRKLIDDRLGQIFDIEYRSLRLTPSTATRPSRSLDTIVEAVDELRIGGKVVLAVVLDVSAGSLTPDLVTTIAENSSALGSLYLLSMPAADEQLVLMNRKVEVLTSAF